MRLTSASISSRNACAFAVMFAAVEMSTSDSTSFEVPERSFFRPSNVFGT